MGLLSFFQRRAAREGAPPVTVEPGSVEAARTRARRRLIGAAVLVALGVIGFPLVFDTAPRPLPVDIPIEIPAKDAIPPLAPPKAAPGRSAAGASAVGRVATAEPAPLLTESASEAGRELPAPVEKAENAEPRPAAATPASAVAPRTVPTEPKPAASKAPARPASAESARALAALEGRSGESGAAPAADAAPAGGRFVVQVGAFSEPNSARDARARVEKLGLKAYTQVVETSGGKRIRVRVGPYGDRGEAEKAAAQIKQAGLSSAVLTL